MISWKDDVGLIYFIINCISFAKNQPDTLFNNYHKMPCCCNKKLSQDLNLAKI